MILTQSHLTHSPFTLSSHSLTLSLTPSTHSTHFSLTPLTSLAHSLHSTHLSRSFIPLTSPLTSDTAHSPSHLSLSRSLIYSLLSLSPSQSFHSPLTHSTCFSTSLTPLTSLSHALHSLLTHSTYLSRSRSHTHSTPFLTAHARSFDVTVEK
jgi:hypothetical protein